MQRSIFEDVSDTKKSAPKAGEADRIKNRNAKIIRIWLMCVAALVVIMILVGGLTRLTDSGLSITEWKPIMGAIPPLSAEDWQIELEKYRQIPEYALVNKGMTLSEFKVIYWWEWGHRQLGRLIGMVYILPFVVLLTMGIIPKYWRLKLLGVGLLGAVQGGIGWWMVASGLVGRVDVAPIRLATHLGLAFVILGVLTWFILQLRMEDWQLLQAKRRRDPKRATWAGVLVALTFTQIFAGALVAGLDAGQWYVDWPLMNGEFLPTESFDLSPFYLNLIENHALVQFNHRMLAYTLLLALLVFYGLTRRAQNRAERDWSTYGLMIVLIQAGIGIATVLKAAPLEWALAHQAAGIVVWIVMLRMRFTMQYPPATEFR